MKKILNFGFVLLLISCTSVKDNLNVIPYIIDMSSEKSIYEEIIKKDNKNVVFYIEHLPDSTLKLHLLNSVDKEFLITNRKLFINDKFYPIIFDTDYLFYSEMKEGHPIISFEVDKNSYRDIAMPSLKERENNPELYGYKKKSILIDSSLYWIIDKKGKLLKTNSN